LFTQLNITNIVGNYRHVTRNNYLLAAYIYTECAFGIAESLRLREGSASVIARGGTFYGV